MAKILVVDDEIDLQDLIRQKFRKQIKSREYDFVFALNGLEALRMIESEQDIDMILSDINMPEMDGLTLLTHVHDKAPLIKSVMVSAYGDMENIRTAMNRGAFDFVTKPINFDDLNITMTKTIGHVLQMKQNLQAIKENNILKMYVDENVINFMGSREYETSLMASESIDATVMFVDICGFTSFSERADATDVVHLLNNYFDVMVKEIIDQKGAVDKFIGDAVMAVFKGEDHMSRATRCALNIRNAINAQPAFEDATTYKPQISIGINTGGMVSGNIGSESLRRLDYTVIGAVVNIAQRLESIANADQIIVSETIQKAMGDQFIMEDVGSVNLKHIEVPMTIYQVVE